jgi:hypothetical protein
MFGTVSVRQVAVFRNRLNGGIPVGKPIQKVHSGSVNLCYVYLWCVPLNRNV